MYYIYVIYSKKHDFMYVGYTKNLKNRLIKHNKGNVKTTKEYKPFELIYYEAYSDKQDAITREYKLKHQGSSVGHLKKRINNSLTECRNQKGGV